jgi:O-methyltransferase
VGALAESDIDYRDRFLDLFKSALCASLYDESAWRRIEGPMRQHATNPFARVRRAALRAIVRAIESRGITMVRRYPFIPEHRQQGIDWPLFGFTQTGRDRLDCLQQCIETIVAEDIPGDIVETGVWHGGSMMLASAVLDSLGDSQRRIWCCDSFEGMPVPTVHDQSFSGSEDFSDLDYIRVGLERVKDNFRRFRVLTDRVHFLKGWFSATLPTAPIEQIALLRLDGDLYESTRDALVPLYPRVSSGGFVLVDDYNSWPGCKQAVTEYRSDHGITAPIVPIDGHAVYWRVE